MHCCIFLQQLNSYTTVLQGQSRWLPIKNDPGVYVLMGIGSSSNRAIWAMFKIYMIYALFQRRGRYTFKIHENSGWKSWHLPSIWIESQPRTSLRCNWSPALQGVNGPSRLVAVVKMKHVVFGWMVRIFIWLEEQKVRLLGWWRKIYLSSLVDWLIAWLVDLVFSVSVDWLIRLFDWLIYAFVSLCICLFDCLLDWLIGGLCGELLFVGWWVSVSESYKSQESQWWAKWWFRWFRITCYVLLGTFSLCMSWEVFLTLQEAWMEIWTVACMTSSSSGRRVPQPPPHPPVLWAQQTQWPQLRPRAPWLLHLPKARLPALVLSAVLIQVV